MIEKQYTPSKYQLAIFDFIKNGNGNAIIEAVAGSGKTTTIIDATKLIPEESRAIFVAFNKNIKEEIHKKIKEMDVPIEVKTLHGLGFSICKKNNDNQVEMNNEKLNSIVTLLCAEEGFIGDKPFISLIKNICRKAKMTYSKLDEKHLNELIAKYDLGNKIKPFELEMVKRSMQKCKEIKTEVDYDDMLLHPVVNDYIIEPYDWVLVDECQDLNPIQIELVKKICKKNTRVICVGDRHQSIYEWRGADPDAMDKLKEHFNAKEFDLPICYRCPQKAIRDYAKEIVWQIEPYEKNKEGVVEYLDQSDFYSLVGVNDLVLCRCNKPLIAFAYNMIQQHRKVVVLGRDLSKNLLDLVKLYEENTLQKFRKKIIDLRDLQHRRLIEIEQGTFDRKRKPHIINSIDTCDTVLLIAERCSTTKEIKEVIYKIFSNKKDGIICSSVHKAKGTENDRVFIIGYDSMMPLNYAKTTLEIQQEMNIKYVAITRTKSELYLIR